MLIIYMSERQEGETLFPPMEILPSAKLVEVAGFEPACLNIRSKASTCLFCSLISPPELQQTEFPMSSLSKPHLTP